jgi:hypothetical protein
LRIERRPARLRGPGGGHGAAHQRRIRQPDPRLDLADIRIEDIGPPAARLKHRLAVDEMGNVANGGLSLAFCGTLHDRPGSPHRPLRQLFTA